MSRRRDKGWEYMRNIPNFIKHGRGFRLREGGYGVKMGELIYLHLELRNRGGIWVF